MSIAGVVVAAGFCTYVSLNPLPFQILGPLVLVSNIHSAVAVQSGRRRLAALLLLPFAALLLYFGSAA